ncbi:hypothetical protein B6S12_01215 [Helicobacter valdiviensis]|uniref:Bacteriocin n=1 Tax=Helicobacter valdiviensis TaxID=1458358 RepID=A0A2W6PQD7_9HELI|nr:hypothetical protein [Helicobacter valdiviensis]PZT48943.1 hypothetical protein B6S12_01215 [Helicobacter valdiviensis]
MKKLLCGSLIALGLISGANATDLISLATNGKANESSLGVKALSNQEMNEIVGGVYIVGNAWHQYGKRNNSGTKVSYTAYYQLGENVRNELLPLNVDDGSRRYKAMIQATLTYSCCGSNSLSYSFIGVNQYNPVYTRPADRYYANQLLAKYKNQIKDGLNHYIYTDADRYWRNNYRSRYSR